MTYKEALTSIMNDGINLGSGDYLPIETLYKCKEALEKQIPKKRRKFEDNYKSFSFDCPECGGYLVSEIDGELCCGQRYKYCHRCGQAIDWSDE